MDETPEVADLLKISEFPIENKSSCSFVRIPRVLSGEKGEGGEAGGHLRWRQEEEGGVEFLVEI